jgi:RNA polymerase sigma-70 factor (ECF subfamily)
MEPENAPQDVAKTIDATTAQMLLHSERSRLQKYVDQHLPKGLTTFIQSADVLQDVYVEAFRRIAQFRPQNETSVFRWLVTIARHHMSMLLRRHRCQKRGGGRAGSVAGSRDSLILMLDELADCHRSPSRSAAAHEFMAALENAVDKLPASLQQAVRLRYLQGWTPDEIAEKMSKTVPAVHMLCHRGLQSLRQELRSASLYI